VIDGAKMGLPAGPPKSHIHVNTFFLLAISSPKWMRMAVYSAYVEQAAVALLQLLDRWDAISPYITPLFFRF